MFRPRIFHCVKHFQMHKFSTTPSAGQRKGSLTLPRLPVPDLHQTLTRYLASLEPLLLEDEARGGMPYQSAYTLRAKWADEFESGLGQLLQERLLALDRASPYNWLDDNFWINKAYLEWRAPLLVNSNWWLAFNDDNMIPESALVGETSDSRAGITLWQMRRAAWLIHRMLDFRRRLDTQELHPETTRTGIWLRENTSKMFNIARIPKPYCDILSPPADPSSSSALKLLLMVHNWCYTIDVYLPPTSPTSSPQLMKPHEIESHIREVVLDVEQRLQNGEKAFPIGILSADGRDHWTSNLAHLLSLSPTNHSNHQAMLNSSMGLSLDHITHTIAPHYPPGPAPSSPQSIHSTTAPQQLTRDAHLHSIRGTLGSVANRFFDKPFTVLVDPSTRAGATGDHSPCDALVPSIVAEFGVVEGIDVAAFGDPGECADVASVGADAGEGVGGWERLEWVVDEKLRKEALAAEERARRIIEDSDDSVLWFEGYGADWIKGVGKLAPDAYAQMVLQLAWYKTRGEFTATYETVLTRMFKRGRTETLRTLTTDSRAFVLTMVDPLSTPIARYTALQRAIRTHTRLTREAATGKGIDRHLLGLRLMLRPLNMEHAALFEDEMFERSQRWKLSTSGLSAGHLFRGTGFGAMYEDGYGINYLTAPEMIKFGIESKFSSPLTSTEQLKEAIVESLYEMRAVCSTPEVIDAHDVSSHL